MKKTRKIVVIVGSKNDLKQCVSGLILLRDFVKKGLAKVTVHVKSVHRHTEKLLSLLRGLSVGGATDVIIAGAGKAAHLPGCVDGYLRNYLKDSKIQVIGVAFEGKSKKDNKAAALSITHVPGRQLIYAGLGNDGFENACHMACVYTEADWPTIELKEPPPDLDLTLEQAYELAITAEG